MKYTLHEKSEDEQDCALSQVKRYARLWGEVGPVLALLANTPRAGSEQFGQFAAPWNAKLEGSVAPIEIIAVHRRCAQWARATGGITDTTP